MASMLAISILFKMAVYFNGLQSTSFDKVGRFANIFILMSGVFFAIRLFKSQTKEATKFLDDVKAGMRIASLYAICMAAFLYFYYEYIDPNYFGELSISHQIEGQEADEATRKRIQEGAEFVRSAYFNSTISLVGFLLLGSFYSAIIAFLVRKFSGFRHP